MRGQLELELDRCQRVDGTYENPRLIMKDTATGTRYLLTVVSGVLTLTATTLP